jgi:hypothetical protein
LSGFAAICERLRLPLIAAPMFRVSGVDLVVAACRSGVIGAFPTANCRSVEELDAWLSAIRAEPLAAPWCANLIVHRSNPRMKDDLAVPLRHSPEIVITSVGSPAEVVAPLHDAGALVFADVASIRHAERAIGAALILLAIFGPSITAGVMVANRSKRALAGTSRHADLKASSRQSNQAVGGVFVGQMIVFFLALRMSNFLVAAGVATLAGIGLAWHATRPKSDDPDPKI